MLEGMMAAAEAQSPMMGPIEQPETQVLDRAQMLGELHTWCKEFVQKSKTWRQQSYESDWLKWQRAARSIYDPALAKKKEPWQSRAVWPVTASHRENAMAQLFKTEMGPKPALDVKARKGAVPENIPGADQSQNIKDLVIREREKSEYETGRNGVLDDKTTYGSGFAQVFFETKVEDRLVQEPILEEISPFDLGSVGRALSGQRQVIGYRPVVRPQVIYRGVRFRPISIWDVFPDPQSLKIEGHPIAVRYMTTYGDVIKGVQEGYYLPESVEQLKGVASEEVTPDDKQESKSQLGIAETRVERPSYGRLLECYEVQARLPKKWVLINGEEIDDPEALIPAKVRFHEQCVISVELNDSYDGEPNIYKDDYMPVAGQLYGVGIPEMLAHVQDVTNESINQRLDAAVVSLLNVYAVIEKSVVDPKDFSLGPGSVIRFKSRDGLTNIDQLFKKIDMGTIDRAAFIEPQEWERAAQERTSITQTSLGTEDNTDTTLGAQKIQQGVTGAKLAYIGMLSEYGFQRQIFRAYWKLIYQNYQPEDYVKAIGMERAATMVPMTPEQVETDYAYFPLGIYEAENKAMRQARMSQWDQQFGMMPWANRLEVAKSELQSMDEDPDRFILPEAQAMQIMDKAQGMAQGMVQQEMAMRDKQEAMEPKPKGPTK